jgi:hypothetical protein
MGRITAARDDERSIWTVSIETLPEKAEEIDELQRASAAQPESAAALFIYSLRIYNEDEKSGLFCLSTVLDSSMLRSSSEEGSRNGLLLSLGSRQRLKEQLQTNPHLLNAYYKGASPGNGYTPSAPPFVLEMHTNPYSGDEKEGDLKLFVKTEGADSDRPVHVKRGKDRLWRVSNNSSRIMGIKPAG